MKISGQMKNFDGIPIMVPNDVISGDGFYVSYNSRDTEFYGCDTTALVKGQMENFLILNGDHTEKYIELIPKGYDACVEYFKENIELKNFGSDKVEDKFHGLEGLNKLIDQKLRR